MTRILHYIGSVGRESNGATMPEYTLMVALIAVVCIIAVGLVGTAANGQFNTIANAIQNAP